MASCANSRFTGRQIPINPIILVSIVSALYQYPAETFRDSVTEDQNPLIARHPNHPNLFIAGGGSYTHAKDLPQVGQLVRDVLNGVGVDIRYQWINASLSTGLHNQPALKSMATFIDLDSQASRDENVQY